MVLIRHRSFCFRQFGIEYPDSESTTINNVALTKDNLKQQAIKFIRCLVEFSQTIDDLPEERWITMKVCVANGEPRASWGSERDGD